MVTQQDRLVVRFRLLKTEFSLLFAGWQIV
jgi:hypothetical protein